MINQTSPRNVPPEDWDATPPCVRQLVLVLLERVSKLEERLYPNSHYDKSRSTEQNHSAHANQRVTVGAKSHSPSPPNLM